jgi:hypothetical protein
MPSPPPKPLPKILLVSLLVIAGGIAGALITVSIMQSGALSTRRADPHVLPPSQVAPHHDPLSDVAVTAPDLREAMSVLSDAISNPDRDARAEALRHLAGRLVLEDVKKALAVGAKIPDANDKLEFMRALFAAWAVRDPLAALDYAKTNFKPGLLQGEVYDAALEKWAARNPLEAWQWLDKNASGPLKEQGLTALMQGWAHEDPRGAAEWFVRIGSTSQAVLNALVSTWADLNPRAAAEWIESLTDPDNKMIGRVTLAGEWAQQSPAAAAEYFTPIIATVDHRMGVDLAAALVNSWGAGDPAAAAEWIAKLPHGAVRDDAAGTLATIWAAADIQAAIKWTDTLTEPEMKKNTIDHLGTTWGAIEPKKALAWLDTLPHDDTRREATRGALNSWAGTDLPGLAEWAAKQPPGPDADLAWQSLGEVQIDRDPSAALQSALSMSDPSVRSDALSRFYRRWRRSDDAGAQQWLQANWVQLPTDLQSRLAKEQQRRVVPQ